MFANLIQTVTVGAGGASSITFTGIPSTFNDLVLVLSARSTTSSPIITLNLNGSAANFSNVYMSTPGAFPSSTATGTTFIGYASATGTDTVDAFGNLFMYLTNYSVATSKTFSVDSASESMATAAYIHMVGGTWANNAVVTSLTLNASNFAQHSSASLYGVKTGSVGGIGIS